ncbi:MAG: protein kinase [Deltaproteobacteria bacterium]|nr:protein kinase [Deltaproteobacteria bacterium]
MPRLGRYELLRHLASGGMAEIHLARTTGVGGFSRHVVLKVVRPERAVDEAYVAMFLDEARLLAGLHHAHLAQVHEVGVDGDTYFLAMEYLHGETLRAILSRARTRHARLSLELALTVVAGVAAGLHHAHEGRDADGQPLGIVHRDVSPGNVMATYDGGVKLIDFGIAKARARTAVTRVGLVKGKPGYMAPEQVLGLTVDRRCDVFALGVVLYELTTQRQPFRATTGVDAIDRMLRGDLTPPSQVVRDYPRELEEIVLTALALDPDARFATAEDLRLALVDAAAHLDLGLSSSAVIDTMRALFGTRREPWLERPAPAPVPSPSPTMRTPVAMPPPVPVPSPARVWCREVDGAARRAGLAGAPGALASAEKPTEVTPAWRGPALALGAMAPVASEPRVSLAPSRPMPRPRVTANGTAPMPMGPLAAATPRSIPWRPIAIAVAAIAASAIVVATIGAIASAGDPGRPASAMIAPVDAMRPDASPDARAPDAIPPDASPDASLDAAPPDAALARLEVHTAPPGATVVLDNQRLGSAPLVTFVAHTTRAVVLKVRKHGYDAVKIRIRIDRDLTWQPILRRSRPR